MLSLSATAPQQSSAALHVETTNLVGSENPIHLPVIAIGDFGPTIGKQIAHGGLATIHEVNDSNPQRVYKIIFLDKFKDGNEIRISKIAGEAGVGPAFHGAYLVEQDGDDFVAIEMDYAGISLNQWSEDLAKKAGLKEESATLSPEEQVLQEQMEKMAAEMNLSFGIKVIESHAVIQASIEDTLDELYETHEAFYFELFSIIRTLAEKNIAYTDGNYGNIIPRSLSGRMQVVDFGQAILMTNIKEAAAKAVRSFHNWSTFEEFTLLQNLSAKSRELISWFFTQLAPSADNPA